MLDSLHIIASLIAAAAIVEPLRTSKDIAALAVTDFPNHRFEVSGQAILSPHLTPHEVFGFNLQNEKEGFDIRTPKNQLPPNGALVTVSGHTGIEADTQIPILVADTIKVHGQAPLPAPTRKSIRSILRGECDYRTIRTQGVVFDAVPDDIDSTWNYLVIRDDTDYIYVAVYDNSRTFRKELNQFIDAEIELSGIVTPALAGFRRFTGPSIKVASRSHLKIIKKPASPPEPFPPFSTLLNARPESLSSMRRKSTKGTVIATWSNDNLLIRTDSGRIMRIELQDPRQLPKYGDFVEVIGFPCTDLLRINLTHAEISSATGQKSISEQTPTQTSAKDFLADKQGRKRFDPRYDGRLIRIRGKIKALSPKDSPESKVYLDCRNFLVPIDISSIQTTDMDIAVGCEVEITGVAVLSTSNWSSGTILPRITDITVIPRIAEDIRVLARPPWWTVKRLFVVICSLIAALAAILIWNKSLRKLAERRGRELYRSEIGKASAELRINERTRLAVELHDSIAQNLTGAFFQVEAADLARQTDSSALERCLKSAMQTIQSCREELRYCLWDLRNNVLDESNAADVLRRTLSPHIGTAKLSIDANLPRSRISDNTFHTILRIARELVSNAARHGKAKNIVVTAQFDKAALVLTVADDGIGFDPLRRPGTDEGHFGLQGIEDRIRKMSGRLAIESAPGRGARISVTFTPEQQERA